MAEPLTVTWINIHKIFHTSDGVPIIPLSTFRQKYGPELKELGLVFRWKEGPGRRPTVACWESKIREWWIRKQQKIWAEKKPRPRKRRRVSGV